MKKVLTIVTIIAGFTVAFANTNDTAEKIAYIGYGSLIDDPRELPKTDDFKETDLQLPIDFLRISGSYIGSSHDHDDTLLGAFCDKKDPARKNHPLYLSVTIAPDEFAKDVTPSNVYSTEYDPNKDKFKEVSTSMFDSARKALMRREGTTLSSNIAFISKSNDAPTDKGGKTVDGYKVSTNAAQLSDNDINKIITW